jgi:hypothetical protein
MKTLVLLLFPQLALAGMPTYDITISAGKHERKNVPVRISLPPAALGVEPKAVLLIDEHGKTVPAQLTRPGLSATNAGREVHFIVAFLKAGDSLNLTAALVATAHDQEDGFAWHDDPGDFTELHFGERRVARYHYRALDETTAASRERTYKVFHHLFSPKGDTLVTAGLSDDPNVHSPHHRGIFFGFNRISYGDGKTADTWHCTNGAYQGHQRFLASEAGSVLGRHRAAIGWHGNDKALFANEDREFTAYNVPGGQLIDFVSRLSTPAGTVKLDGDTQHAGVHFRADNEVFAKTSAQTIYVRPDGTGKPGETRNWDPATRKGPVNLPWNAMSFVLKSKRYTVAYLVHPTNPKEARYSEREFGRFGCYFEYTLTKDRPLLVQYRFWLQDGLMSPEQVAKLSADFIEPVDVTVKAR